MYNSFSDAIKKVESLNPSDLHLIISNKENTSTLNTTCWEEVLIRLTKGQRVHHTLGYDFLIGNTKVELKRTHDKSDVPFGNICLQVSARPEFLDLKDGILMCVYTHQNKVICFDTNILSSFIKDTVHKDVIDAKKGSFNRYQFQKLNWDEDNLKLPTVAGAEFKLSNEGDICLHVRVIDCKPHEKKLGYLEKESEYYTDILKTFLREGDI